MKSLKECRFSRWNTQKFPLHANHGGRHFQRFYVSFQENPSFDPASFELKHSIMSNNNTGAQKKPITLRSSLLLGAYSMAFLHGRPQPTLSFWPISRCLLNCLQIEKPEIFSPLYSQISNIEEHLWKFVLCVTLPY